MTARIKTGDDVVVIAGKDKGRRGTVTQIKGNGRLIVEGINLAKKHVRPNPNAGIQGGITEVEMGIHASNVMLFNAEADKGDRVGYRVNDAGQKERYFKSNGKAVDA